jgi:hypothetical protein
MVKKGHTFGARVLSTFELLCPLFHPFWPKLSQEPFGSSQKWVFRRKCLRGRSWKMAKITVFDQKSPFSHDPQPEPYNRGSSYATRGIQIGSGHDHPFGHHFRANARDHPLGSPRSPASIASATRLAHTRVWHTRGERQRTCDACDFGTHAGRDSEHATHVTFVLERFPVTSCERTCLS